MFKDIELRFSHQIDFDDIKKMKEFDRVQAIAMKSFSDGEITNIYHMYYFDDKHKKRIRIIWESEFKGTVRIRLEVVQPDNCVGGHLYSIQEGGSLADLSCD